MQCVVRLVNSTYRLRNIVYNNSAVGVSIVHGSERFVSLLASRIPDLKLDSCVLVQRDGLCKERSTDGGFAERVELILDNKLATKDSCEMKLDRLTHLYESQDNRTLDACVSTSFQVHA
jgi:hypothetical protein